MTDICRHNQRNHVTARLIYLEDVDRYYLEVDCKCYDCGTRFAFLGMQAGLNPVSPMCSVGRLEARLPVEPDPYATSMLAEAKQ